MQKPEAQTLGVSGIEPKPVNTPDQGANWPAIAALPPFQMFAVERAYLSQGEIEMLTGFQGPNAMRVLQNLVFRAGNDINALYDDYCQWHAEKGYWSNEDPLGRIKQ